MIYLRDITKEQEMLIRDACDYHEEVKTNPTGWRIYDGAPNHVIVACTHMDNVDMGEFLNAIDVDPGLVEWDEWYNTFKFDKYDPSEKCNTRSIRATVQSILKGICYSSYAEHEEFDNYNEE